MKKQSLLLLSLATLALSNCATTPLKPGAENIVVTDATHAPTSCKNLGQVAAFDTNGTSVTYTSHERMQQYQTNILKNKTFDLGGNVIEITEHKTTYIGPKDTDLMDTHLMEGIAYQCSAEQLKKVVPSVTSDLNSVEAAGKD